MRQNLRDLLSMKFDDGKQVHMECMVSSSRCVGADDISDDSPAQRTVATAFTLPLLYRTLVAHAHMSTHV